MIQSLHLIRLQMFLVSEICTWDSNAPQSVFYPLYHMYELLTLKILFLDDPKPTWAGAMRGKVVDILRIKMYLLCKIF